ncbi:hypothetical protein TD95_005188 [Thielaviopsis punctulata]|uniref:Uncharacterized protein n=1 Tax=Thielaviopsis punctulata TaxID=72032 RepID=A0A0F4ZAC6_9PEZI|nr:hypothetical protein TD95_005188 [Thielaviopsis punctulata]
MNKCPPTYLSSALPAIDMSKLCDPRIKGKTVIITGGAQGIGSFNSLGAHLVITDCNVQAGQALVASLRTAHPHGFFPFHQCNVASRDSQVDLFEAADKASNDRGIDVNMTSTVYTANLGLIYMGNVRNQRRIRAGQRPRRRLFAADSIHRRNNFRAGAVLHDQAYCRGSVLGAAPVERGRARRCAQTCCVPQSGIAPLIVVGITNTGSPGICEMEDMVEAATLLAAEPNNVGRGLVVAPRLKS